MKKIFITTVAIVSFATIFTGCSTSKDTSTTSKKNVATTATQIPKEKTLSDLTTYLKNKNLLKGKPEKTQASMIGAKDGIKYEKSEVEFYEYDKSSKEYKSLLNGDSVQIEGMEGFTVTAGAVNDKFVLIFRDEGNKDKKILSAFKNFK